MLLLVLTLAGSTPAATADRPLVFGGDEYFPPFESLENGKPTGYNVDLIRALSKAMGRDIEIRLMQFGEAQRQVLNGELDALTMAAITNEREALFDFSEVTFRTDFVIFIQSNRSDIRTVPDLQGKTVAVKRGGAAGEALESNPNIRKVYVKTDLEGLNLLADQQVDAFCGSRWVGAYAIQSNGISGITITDAIVASTDAAIAVKEGNAELLNRINSALDQLKNEGTLATLESTWAPTRIFFLTYKRAYEAAALIVIGLTVAILWTATLMRSNAKLRRAEKELSKRAEEVERLLETVPAAVWVSHDPQCMTIIGNRRANEFYEAKTGENVSATSLPEERRFFTADGRELRADELPMQRAVAANQDIMDTELRVQLPSGRRIAMLGSAAPLRDPDGSARGCIGAFMDITDRMETEQALRESEEQFRVLTQNLVSGVALINGRGEICIVNRSFLRLFNLGEDDPILNANSRDWSQWKVFDEAGRLLDVDEHPVRKAALTLTAVRDMLVAMQAPDCTERTWMLVSAEPLLDAKGNLHRLICTYHDITERVQAEDALHRLNESLELMVGERTADLHAANRALEQRAAQLRELAGELAMTEQRERKAIAKLLHDGLQQYLVAARMRQSALIDELEEHAAKSARDVEGLLVESINVSRSLAIELCPPALDGGIMAGLEWLTRFMAGKHGLNVKLQIDTGAPVLPENVKVFVFESVRELLLNVVKHSKSLAATVHLQEDRHQLKVTVSDEGVGFDPAAVQQRESGGAFGLFSIRERIGLVGGSIELDSAPGQGARFTITAPLVSSEAPQPSPATCSYIDTSAGASNGKIKILLADDHKVMRESLALMLGGEHDFEIVGQAEDGNAAVELTQVLRPAVVLMDLTMPNMDGITATRIIVERHPDVRVIGLSFYRAEERAEEMMAAGASLYVSKTAPAEDLKRAIRSCAG